MNWTRASPPKVINGNFNYWIRVADQQRAGLIWFNPFSQVRIKDIWPNRDVNAKPASISDVLGLEVWRNAEQDAGRQLGRASCVPPASFCQPATYQIHRDVDQGRYHYNES